MRRRLLAWATAAAAAVLAATAAPAAASAARVPPSSVLGDCDSGTAPIVVASDVAAQSDIYSAVTLAGVLDDACIVLAGARTEAMPADQRARLDAAATGGYVVGGQAAVPDGKIAGRTMARLGGSDRWVTALLVGSEAAGPGSAPRTSVAADVQFSPAPGSSGTASAQVRVPPASVRGECDADTVPVVVASDLAAQSDIYSAVTLAGVLGEACIVLAGARGEQMPVDQQARLLAAAAGGYVVGGQAAVPDGKIAGRSVARLGGADRWETALLVGSEAAEPGSAPRTTVPSDARFEPSGDSPESSGAKSAQKPWSVFEIIAPPDTSDRVYGAYDPYYTQATTVGSLHVIADAGVDPEAVQRTAYIITQMLANRPDVIEQMARWTYVVVGKTQLPQSSVPEVRALPQWLVEEWEADRSRIIGGGWGPSVCLGCDGGGALPFTMVSEANALCSGHPIDTHTTEDVVVHELAHGIHASFELEQEAAGVGRDDPESFDHRVQELYDGVIASGIWEGHYAATNHGEYFAEMLQYWSGTNDNDYVWTMTLNRPFELSRQRQELAAYDPQVAEFLAEHFGEVAVTGSCHYYQ